MIVPARPPRSTIEELFAISDAERFHELIDGELTRKVQPSPRHAQAQTKLGEIVGPYHRRGGGPPDRPGGWWFLTEPEVLVAGELVRPDVAGWRREHLPELPDEAVVARAPDWVCEIISPSRPTRDTVTKKRLYHRWRVGHYWLLDPRDETLTVLRWHEPGFIEVVVAERSERLRAEPFDAFELSVGTLFGDDD